MKMGERNFETPNLGGDLWPIGFDMDLALDAHSSRKNSTAINSVGPSSSSPMVGGGVNIGYGDMQHMLLHRFEDDLNEGDISQITDLTNSLPKGDTDTAHGFLTKIACHDLTRELGSTQGGGSIPKGIDATLFGQTNDGNVPNNILSHKPPLHPVDVYGRVTLFEGKLVLQLKHFNVNTHYPISVSECWLCREKMSNGSQIHSHKHILQGLFQVNDEFVQMDIDHYIIPEQALEPDPTDVNRNLTSAMIVTTPVHSTLAHHVTENRALSLAEDIECPEALPNEHVSMNTIGNALHNPQRPLEPGVESLQTPKDHSEIHYTETDLNNALSSAQQSLNGTMPRIDSQAFLNPFSNDIRIGSTSGPQIVATQDTSLMNQAANSSNSSVSFPPPPPLPPCPAITNNANPNSLASTEGMISTANTPGPHSTLNDMENIEDLCSSSTSSSSIAVSKIDGFSQHTTYEPNISTNKEHLDNYHNFFGHHYSYSYDSSSLKFPVDAQPTPSSNTHICPPPASPTKRPEVGAKKRKSRAQKKPSIIRMKEEVDECLDSVSFAEDKVEIKTTLRMNFTSESNIEPKHISPSTVSTQSNDPVGGEPMKREYAANEQIQPKPLTDVNDVLASNTRQAMPKSDFRIPCPFCRVDFSNKNITMLSNHIKMHKFEPSYVFKCSFCIKSVQSLDKYIRHLKIHSEKRHFCSKCDAHYSRRDKLRRHVTNVHDLQKPFVCDICSKSFNRLDYLKTHKNIHIGKKLECDICHHLFSSQFNLKAHKKLHTSEKLPFPCELCDKTFSRKDFLTSHISRDHKNKRFKCDICFKLFSRNDVLTRHKVTHDEKRVTYDCEVCGKKFRRKDKLKAHSYGHKESKNGCKRETKSRLKENNLLKQLKGTKTKQQCSICFKYLPSTLKLEKHLRCHETQIALKVNIKKTYSKKTHKCQLCSKSFKTEELMERHALSHYIKSEDYDGSPNSSQTEVKEATRRRFSCEVCSKSFTRSYNLKVHLKTHLQSSQKPTNPSSCEDDQVLAELSTVLNASKSNLKRRKKSRFTLTHDDGASSAILPQPTMYCTTKELSSSPPSASFHLPLEEGFVPITSNHSPYNPHLPPHLPHDLPISSSSFCSSSPSSPINLSTEAISAAAYLLAHPFYEGPYQ